MLAEVKSHVDSIETALWHFAGWKLCRQHSDSDDAICDQIEKQWELAWNTIKQSCGEMRQFNDPRDITIETLQAELKLAQAAREKAESDARAAKAKVSGLNEELSTARSQVDSLKSISQELQQKNLSRPEISDIVIRTMAILVGLRTVQIVEDRQDINRQLACGMMLTCQLILKACGAVADVRSDGLHELFSTYYASLPQRDIDYLKSNGMCHN